MVGLGSAGRQIATALVEGAIPGVSLTAVSVRDAAKAQAFLSDRNFDIPVVPLSRLADHCDIAIEVATGAAMPEIVENISVRGTDLICVSAGGLLAIPDLESILEANGAMLQIATGAIPGLDILRSAAEGTIDSVHLTTRVKTESLAHEPFVLQQGLDFRAAAPTAPVRVFHGSAADAARAFPRHLNVAVSLSLAGIGFERTTIEMWIDPHVSGAVHSLRVEGLEIALTLESRNVPSLNPKTSRIVAPSVLAALRSRVARIRVGS